MKNALIVLTAAVVCCVIFFLFEPVFLHNFGRKELPNLNELQPEIVNTDQTNLQLDNLLKDSFLKLKTPALSVAIAKQNSLVWANAIGYASIEEKTKASTQTMFRIGSTSKAVTSVGLGVLIESKKLALDSKVKDYLSDVSQPLSEVSIKQLASHTSGIRNYKTCFCFPIWENLNNDQYNSVAESITVFNHDPLLFKPGTNFSYSTYNYTLLSAIMEVASQEDFVSFINKEVFQPLDLKNTKPDRSDKEYVTRSKFYEVENGSFKEAYLVNNSNKWAGGGFISTPSDLALLGSSILNTSLISEETTSLLLQPTTLENGRVNEQNYALGWRNSYTEKMFDGSKKIQIIHHGGTAAGGTSLLILFPDYDLSLSLLMNKSGSAIDLFEYAYKFVEAYLSALKSIENRAIIED